MKLGQIIKMAMMQSGEDIEDTEEYRERMIVYINEGYRRMMEKFRPTKTETLYADDGEIDLAGIRDMIEIESVRRNETGREERYEPQADGKIRVSSDSAYDVEYTYEPRALEKDTDEPELPQGAHMALSDYATWRYYGNGNIAKQQRGQFYYQRFMMELDRLTPQKQRGGGHRNFHGLFECT